jgi:hypothetical protein
MARPERPKVKIKIKTRFTDEQGGQLFGPGEWEVDPEVSMRLIAQGRATLVGGAAKAAQTKEPLKPPPPNPRIPPVETEEGDTTETPLPDDFPSKEVLAGAGFATVESLRVPDVKEKLGAVDGLGAADITKIGLAISKI